MRIKKKNVAKLASISALGAGALGVAAGTAEAGTIVYQSINATVGPCCAASTFVTFKGPSGSNLLGSPGFQAWWTSRGGGSSSFRTLASVTGFNGVMFKVADPGSFLFFGSAGRKWSTLTAFKSAQNAIVGSRGYTRFPTWVKGSYTHYNYYYHSPGGAITGTGTRTGTGTSGGHFTTITGDLWAHGDTGGNVYAQFEFPYLGNPVYGWLEFSDSVNEGGGGGGGTRPVPDPLST